MPHRFLMEDGHTWTVEREYDPGYLGNGSKRDHFRLGRLLIKAVARTGKYAGTIQYEGRNYYVKREE